MSTACGCPICESYARHGNKAAVGRELGLPRSTVFDHLDAQGQVVNKPSEIGIPGYGFREFLRDAIRAHQESMPPRPATAPVPAPPLPPGSGSRVRNAGGGLVDHVGACGKVLGLFDLHLPWVHERAFDAALAYAADLKPDLLIIGGDGLDCHTISRHEHDNFRKLQQEIDESRPYLDRLATVAPRTIYLEGNHDVRVATLGKNIPALQDLKVLEFPSVVGLPADWEYHASQTHYRIGGPQGLIWLHGDIAGGPKAATGIAHKLRTRLASSVIFGHFHADQVAPHVVSYSGEVEREGHAIGWLGDAARAAGYVASPNWQTSFATAHFGTDPGDWCVEHHLWKRGAFRIHGKKYS